MKKIRKQNPDRPMERRFMENFIWVLVLTGFAEYVVGLAINLLFIPLFQKLLIVDSRPLSRMSTGDIFYLIGMLFIIIFFGLFAVIVPVLRMQSMRIQQAAQISLFARLPELREAAEASGWRDLSFGNGVLLFVLIIGTILLMAAPFMLAAIWYSKFLTKEMKKIRQAEMDAHMKQDQERNLMLSDIAHDIRNPITTIKGYSSALESGMVSDPEQQKLYLKAMVRKSDRIATLINLLFEYSKLNSAGFELKKEKRDINEFVRECVTQVYDDIESNGMILDVDIPERVWELEFDPVQMGRVITNLVTNAIRHNPPDTRIYIRSGGMLNYYAPSKTYAQMKEEGLVAIPGRKHHIRWWLNEEEAKAKVATWQIVIADSGQPIPEEVRDKMFKPFAMGDESRSTKGGSGLGLSIAAQIVQMHGWELTETDRIPGYTKAFVITVYQ